LRTGPHASGAGDGAVSVRLWIVHHVRCGYAAQRRSPRGYSLMELLVVIVIIGTMAAVVIPTFLNMGYFSRSEMPRSARDLYAFLRAAKIYAATYRVDAGLAYGVALKLDSVTGQAVETIDAAAMIYKMPKEVRERCTFPGGASAQASQRINEYAFVPVTGEHEQGMFRPLVNRTGVLCENLLPQGDNSLSKTLRSVRIYQVAYLGRNPTTGEAQYEATLVTPSVLDDSDTALLNGLPGRLQYLAALPAGKKYIEYIPDLTGPPEEGNIMDLRYPAHVFTSSGRMDTGDAAGERFPMYIGYAPHADPVERYVTDPPTADNARKIELDFYRGSGRVAIVPD
jgi:prepilin-type N-terminal cleavage/methylation domain-containing protein